MSSDRERELVFWLAVMREERDEIREALVRAVESGYQDHAECIGCGRTERPPGGWGAWDVAGPVHRPHAPWCQLFALGVAGVELAPPSHAHALELPTHLRELELPSAPTSAA